MGMKVKVHKKRRVRLTLKAYAYPGLVVQKFQSLAVAGLPVLILGMVLLYSGVTAPGPTEDAPGRGGSVLYFGTGLIAWLGLSWLIAWRCCTAGDRSRIKKAGLKAKVMANNMPEIKSLVSEHCKAVGVKEPETYVMEEENSRVRILGGGKPILVISSNMQELLKPEEFQCAVFRALAELRAGAVGLKSWVRFMRETSQILRICLFPAHAVAYLLQQNWDLMADVTTDRLLLITTRHARLCLATIMHLAVEDSPLAQIDHTDVEAYLQKRDGVQATTEGVSTHFKMGTGLQTVPGLNERIQEFIKYSASDEYKELIGKIDEVLG